MSQPGAKALGAGAGRMKREPAGPVVRFSEPFGGDGDDLVFMNTAESHRRILAPDPPGPSSPPHQPVEHHALADLDEGHIALPRGATFEPHSIARLEQRPHGESARTHLDGPVLEGVLESAPGLRRLASHGRTGPAVGRTSSWLGDAPPPA